MWRTRWTMPAPYGAERSHPPVLLVFHQIGARPTVGQMNKIADLTRPHWQGWWRRLPLLQRQDPDRGDHAGMATRARPGRASPFWRFGRKDRQVLTDTIGTPRHDTALTRRAAAAAERKRAARDAEWKAHRQRQQEEWQRREASRWPCPSTPTTTVTVRIWRAAVSASTAAAIVNAWPGRMPKSKPRGNASAAATACSDGYAAEHQTDNCRRARTRPPGWRPFPSTGASCGLLEAAARDGDLRAEVLALDRGLPRGGRERLAVFDESAAQAVAALPGHGPGGAPGGGDGSRASRRSSVRAPTVEQPAARSHAAARSYPRAARL